MEKLCVAPPALHPHVHTFALKEASSLAQWRQRNPVPKALSSESTPLQTEWMADLILLVTLINSWVVKVGVEKQVRKLADLTNTEL